MASVRTATPKATVTTFTGSGTNSVEVALGVTSPDILIFYLTYPLTSGKFYKNSTGTAQRAFMLFDGDFTRGYYSDLRTLTSSSGSLSLASSARLEYQNSVLSFPNSTSTFKSGAVYKCIAVEKGAPNATITDIVGNGTTNVTADIGISNPKHLVIYATAPLSTGKYVSSSSAQRAFGLMDLDSDSIRQLYANIKNSTSSFDFMGVTTLKQIGYENGDVIFGVSGSTPSRNNYAYRVIAIE